MYDNGIVSFLNPSDPQAVNPGQWSAPPGLGFSGKYYIAALWADIAPTASTQYKTIYDGASLKYLWNNVSEYYSGGTRLNSFSTTIKPDGSVATSYYSLNLNTSNVIAGTVGDPELGEITQIYSANFGTQVSTIPDWSLAGKPDPCSGSQYWLPGCPGYKAPEVVEAQPQPQTAQESAVATPEPAVVPQSTTAQQPTPVTSTQTQTVQRAADITPSSAPQQQRASPSISTGAILQIVRSEQSRVQAVEAAAVSTSQQQAQETVTASVQQTTATQSAKSSVIQQGAELSYITQAVTAQQPSLQEATVVQHSSSQTVQKSSTVPEPTSFTAGLTDPVAVVSLVAPQPATTSQPQPTTAVNRQATENAVAGGVGLKNLATVPAGFQAYQTALQDQPFYASREIYARQTVADNVRAGRLLNLASDRKHQQMLQQQYRQGE